MTDSLPLALALAGIVTAVSPLGLRYIKLDGLQMAALSYVVSLALAAAAGLLTGQLHPTTASVMAVLAGSGAFWSVQQGVFKVLYAADPAVVNPPVPPPVKPAP